MFSGLILYAGMRLRLVFPDHFRYNKDEEKP